MDYQTGINLTRAILIFLQKDGRFDFARKGTRRHSRLCKEGFIPCASVGTIEQAQSLQVCICKLTREPNSTPYTSTRSTIPSKA